MTTAYKAFRRIQAGLEGTPGTAVAATEILYGVLSTFESGDVLHQPEEDRNSLARYMADDLFVGEEAKIVWAGDVNFRHLAWVLGMALRGNITPSQPDSSNEPNAYLWTYNPALTTSNTPDQTNGIDTYTIEYGDNLQAYEVEYCFATKLAISGAPNETCKFSLDITGRQRSDVTFTGSLTAQSVQRAPFNLAKFYIDTAGSSIGNTQKTGLLKAFTWTLDTKFAPVYTADGNLYFASLTEDRKAPELSLTYVRGSDADSERTKYENRTTSFLRIQLFGGTELDSSQSNPPYLALDTAVRYRTWPTFGDDNGLATVQVVADAVYDATWAKSFQVLLFTDLSALPT
jgi:hypothetical protein